MSLQMEAAWLETRQGSPFKLRPPVYGADSEPIHDLTDQDTMSPSCGQAKMLITIATGIVVPSFAPPEQ